MSNDLALASLQQLTAGLTNVRASIATPASEPFLRMQKDGTWLWGADDVEVQEGSQWAINPYSLVHGWVAWTEYGEGKKNEKVGEVMVSMFKPKPAHDQLPPVNGKWSEQLGMQLRCLNGEDKGQQVLYKTLSVGGRDAVGTLLDKIIDQIGKDPANAVPVVLLKTSTFKSPKWGKIYKPVFEVVKWLPTEGTSATTSLPSADAKPARAGAVEEAGPVDAVPDAAGPVPGATVRRRRTAA